MDTFGHIPGKTDTFGHVFRGLVQIHSPKRQLFQTRYIDQSPMLTRWLQLRLPDNADNQRNHVDNDTICSRNQSGRDSCPNDVHIHVRFALHDRFCHGHETTDRPKPSGGKCYKTGFSHPGRSFPGNKEQGYQKQGHNSDSEWIGREDKTRWKRLDVRGSMTILFFVGQ